MLREEDIVKGCKKFDSSSQQALYNRYSQKMYGVCLRYIADKDEAKDILQDGFIKVLSHFNQYKGDGSLEGWIRKVITNTALMHLRQKKKMLIEPINNDDSIRNDEAESNNNDYAVLGNMDFTEEELFVAINLLPDDFRVVFNLFCIDNYSHKEISNLLLINENTSRSRLSRARNLLQNYLLNMAYEKEKNNNPINALL